MFLAGVLLDVVFRRIPRVPGGRFRSSAQCDVLDHETVAAWPGVGVSWGMRPRVGVLSCVYGVRIVDETLDRIHMLPGSGCESTRGICDPGTHS